MGDFSVQKQGNQFAVMKGEEQLHVFPSEGEANLQVSYLEEKAKEEAEKPAAKAPTPEDEEAAEDAQKIPHPGSHAAATATAKSPASKTDPGARAGSATSSRK